MSEFCNHYQAAAFNKVCKKGIQYSSFGSAQELPCWDETKSSKCPLAEYPTAEQRAERERWIAGKIEAMMNFSEHKTDICFHCGKQVTSLKKVGRCVYGSCGCRMWQGSVPKEWKAK